MIFIDFESENPPFKDEYLIQGASDSYSLNV